MSVLLAPDEVSLYAPPGDQDGHGWSYGPPDDAPPVWKGMASMQVGSGLSSNGAETGGGAGPYAPSTVLTGFAYLPPGASPRDGMVAVYSGGRYLLGECRFLVDPTGTGALDAWVCQITEQRELE